MDPLYCSCRRSSPSLSGSNCTAERLAVEGDLAQLEQAWREAEEIAAIAYDMFLPPGIGDELSRMRSR